MPVTNNGCHKVTLANRSLKSISCPLMQKTGRTIIEFGNNVIRSDLGEVYSYAGPVLASVLSGTYDLTFLSYDNHFFENSSQPNEQWYIVLKNQLGQTVVPTSSVSDLPASDDWILEKVETDFSVSEDIASVTAVHMAYPDSNPNTISPRCVAFDEIISYDFGGYFSLPPLPVLGCTDSTATNYNPLATQDDGSCLYPPGPVLGCTDPTATNYNIGATVDEGSCK